MSLGQNFDGVHDFIFFFLKRPIIWPLKPVSVYAALKEGWERVLHTVFQDLLLGGNFFCFCLLGKCSAVLGSVHASRHACSAEEERGTEALAVS